MKLPHGELGTGPALLLLHAGVAHRGMWDEHMQPLAAAGFRVIAVDLPGFGEATAVGEPVAHWEDVVVTMDALGVERASLAGCSFGAAVALRVAAVHPKRVSSLLLFSAAAAPEPEPSPQLLAAWEAEEEALAAGDLEKAVAATVSSWVQPEAPEEVRVRIAAMQRQNYDLHSSAGELEHASDPLEEDPAMVSGIECPVLLAAGEADMIDFKNAVTELAERLPQATTTTIAGCGHLAPLEAPEEFRRLVLEALS